MPACLESKQARCELSRGCGALEELLGQGPEPGIPPPDPTARSSTASGKGLDFLEPHVIPLTRGVIAPVWPVCLLGSQEGQGGVRGLGKGELNAV